MAYPVYRYGLDPTGVSPDNFVPNEPYTLADRRVRAIVPKEGSFYGDSVALVDSATGQPLTKGIHYVCAEYLRTPSTMYGKPVYGVILVIDAKVSATGLVSYQAVGGHYSTTTDTLKSLLEQKRDDGSDYNYYDVVGKPDAFNPVPHFHSLSDGMKFEYMVFMLERIRNAILWKDSPALQDIYNYINALLTELEAKLKLKMDAFILPILLDFKAQITKATMGLDKVENLRIATIEEGSKAALKETNISDFLERKYVALDTIVAFKDILYQHMVTKQATGIGTMSATYVTARREKLFDMVNGSRVSFLSRRESAAASTAFDQDVYPKDVDDDTRIAIVKIVSNRNNNGGIYLAYEYGGKGAYFGVHVSGNAVDEMNWKKFLFSDDLALYTDELARHISDTNNPHKTNKDQVGLSEVENLPVISREEILCLKSVRKYLTFDGFLLFMKAFMIGKNGSAADPGNESNEPLENCQIIYCPCSPCGCGTGGGGGGTTPVHPPVGTLLEQFCKGFDSWGKYANGAGGTYEATIMTNSTDCGYVPPPAPPARGTLISNFCKGTTKWGKFADGNGGSYDEQVQEKSTDCGYVAANPKIEYSSNRTTLSAGTVETMTVKLSGYNPGTSVTIHWMINGPWGDYKDKDVRQDQLSIDANGNAVFTLTQTDEGITPRGTYDNWITTQFPDVTSNHITRTFLGSTAKPTMTFSTSLTTITKGSTENITVNMSGFTPNTSVLLKGIVKSPVLNNGADYVAVNEFVNINSSGNYTWTVTEVDDGVTFPRGTYQSWFTVESLDVKSNVINRTFVGPTNPAAGTLLSQACEGTTLMGTYANGSGGTYKQAIAYNSTTCGYVAATPKMTFSSTHSTISKGTTETLTLTLSGFTPNSTVTIKGHNTSPALNNGQDYITVNENVTVNSSGSYVWTARPTDDGTTTPRGSYQCWFTVDSLNLSSNTITRVFVGPANTVVNRRLLVTERYGGEAGYVDLAYDSSAPYFDVTGITSLVSSNLGGMATSSSGWGWSVLNLYFKSGGATYATTISYDSNGLGYPRTTSVNGAGAMRFMTSQLPPNIATASDLTVVGLFTRYGGQGS